MFGKEFAHIHPPSDGSLHMTLPPDMVPQVIETAGRSCIRWRVNTACPETS